jgi:hypothetical protein
MIIIWSASVFSSCLILFQLKYLKGNIYKNTKSFAISDGFAKIFGGIIYTYFGVMKSFLITFFISLAGVAGVYCVQADLIDFQQLHFNYLNITIILTPENVMPCLTMITKFGIAATNLACYSASFTDERIFPSRKRATATAICNIIARSLAVFAP